MTYPTAPSRSRRSRFRPLLVAAALTAGMPVAGCLEGNSGSPEGGFPTSADSGMRGSPDTGMVTAPHADATMQNDAGATKDAGHDASMTMGTPDTGKGGGVDSGTGKDAGPVIPLCKDPTPTETACNTCVESSCSSLATAALAACSGFYACYAACECSDMACVNDCEMNAAAACDMPAGNLIMCSMSMCATACAAPDSGTPTADAGPPKDSGAGLPICKQATAAEIACNDCAESKCSSQASAAASACSKFYSCYTGCDCSDSSCITGCESEAPAGCDTPAENLITCEKSQCASACAAPDGGSTTDGGSSGSIPDCKNPTTAEQMTYTTCSACDNSKCASEVSAAVSACAQYYQCFATTGCATALFGACDGFANADCDDAIGALSTCQGTYCSADCG